MVQAAKDNLNNPISKTIIEGGFYSAFFTVNSEFFLETPHFQMFLLNFSCLFRQFQLKDR